VLTTPDLRQDITSQLHAFRKAQGMFGSNIAKEARNNTSPGMRHGLCQLHCSNIPE